MDTTASSFAARGNAKRAAERMIANGTALAVNYDIRLREDERFEIVWNTAPTTGESKPKMLRLRLRLTVRTATTAATRFSRSTATRTIWHPKPRLMKPLLPLRMSPRHRTPRRRAKPQRITNGQTVPA